MCESGKGELLRCNFFNGVGDDEIGTFVFFLYFIYTFLARGFWARRGMGRNTFSPVFYGVSRVPGGILNNLFSGWYRVGFLEFETFRLYRFAFLTFSPPLSTQPVLSHLPGFKRLFLVYFSIKSELASANAMAFLFNSSGAIKEKENVWVQGTGLLYNIGSRLLFNV